MNFKKLIFIIYTLSLIYGQAYSTPKTIKPLIELENENQSIEVSFIGIEGETQQGGSVNYKKAKIYNIFKNTGTVQPEKTLISLPEKDPSFFFGAKKGDISGEGVPEIIFFITNPTSGTKINAYSLGQDKILRDINKSFRARSKQKQPTLLNTALATIYEDKDEEIIISFGAPDRKIMIINDSGELSAKTIAKKFLANSVGVIKFLTPDLNKDNVADIYILSNSPNVKEEQVYLSPNHNPEGPAKTINIEENIKDVCFITNKEEENLKMFLLDNNEVYVEEWNKKFPINTDKAQTIIGFQNSKLSILDQNGTIVLLEVGKKTIEQKQKIVSEFKNKEFNKTEHLLLKNGKIIISHNDPSNKLKSEIVLTNVYTKENNAKSEKTEPGELIQKTEEETPLVQNKPPLNKEKNEATKIDNNLIAEEKTKETQLKTRKKEARHDTVFVNVGEKSIINIERNPNFLFINLEKTKGPETMVLEREKMRFSWEPTKKDKGFNKLEYKITYNTTKELEEYEEGGIQKLKPKQDLLIQERTYSIFVNARPEISISPSTSYKVKSQKEMIIPLYVYDDNPEHNNQLNIEWKSRSVDNAHIENRRFFWTPKNKHFGKNNIIFTVSDGHIESSETIEVQVDTTKINMASRTTEVATVNEEFLHKIPLEKGARATILEGPENIRISKEHIHWIPTKPQLGINSIIIEIYEEKQTLLYSLDVFVNAPPVISYRPNDTVYVDLNDNFSFMLKSFDENENPSLEWKYLGGPEEMIFDKGQLNWNASIPDLHSYTIELDDGYSSDVFRGLVYVNDSPKITSIYTTYITLGETYEYNIMFEDKNVKAPSGEPNKPSIFLTTHPLGMKLENQTIKWTPQKNQLGPSPVTIEVYDKIEKAEQEFIVFVNDIPKIISEDSIKIAIGDTLGHFVKAEDENSFLGFSYGISANDLDNMMINGKTGEIVWVPKEKDLGYNTIQVSVSDEFDNLGKDMQTITILVYNNPKFIDVVFPEAYAGVEYSHVIGAENMNKQNIPGKDVFVNFLETTFKEASFDSLTYELRLFPTLDEMGTQNITLSLEDNYSNKIIENFPIKVLTSPCETSDTTYIATNNEGTLERSSTIIQKKYYKKEKSILEESGYLKDSTPHQYIEIAEINKTEIIDTVFLYKSEKEKLFPELTNIIDENGTTNKLSKRQLRKINRFNKKKEKKANQRKPATTELSFNKDITFESNNPKSDFNENISFKPKPRPKELPEKTDIYKVKNETTQKYVLAILEDPDPPPQNKLMEEKKKKEPENLGHEIKGDKTHIKNNKWNLNKNIVKDGNGLPMKNSKGDPVIKLNYDKAFYYPGDEFNYKATYWNGAEGKKKLTN